MDIQKLLKPLLLVSSCLIATQASAASIGTYTFADNAIANQISGNGQAYNGTDWYSASGSTWQIYDNTSTSWLASSAPNDTTDTSVSTFLAATQSSSPLSLDLGFSQTSAINGAGADIAFFFIFDQSANTANVTINGTTQALTFSNVFDSNGVQQVANNVAWNNSILSNVQLMAGVINLDDFGYSLGDVINGPVNINLTSTNGNAIALSMAAALNSSPVPLPAPLLLLLSGLAGLGLIGRRK